MSSLRNNYTGCDETSTGAHPIEEVMGMTLEVSKRFRSDSDLTDKSLTCPVCGRAFPRGGVDLERHCSAKTLTHYASMNKVVGTGLTVKCTCGLFFASNEHMQLHRHTICDDTGPHEKIMPIPVNNAKSLSSPSSGSHFGSSSSSKSRSDASSGSGSPAKAATGARKRTASSSSSSSGSGSGSGSGSSSSSGSDSKRPKCENDGDRGGGGSSPHGLGKRTRIVDPVDRRAFFAVVTQLIDPALVESKAGGKSKKKAVRLTVDNFELFVPAKRRHVLERLKELLNWDA